MDVEDDIMANLISAFAMLSHLSVCNTYALSEGCFTLNAAVVYSPFWLSHRARIAS